MEFDNTLEVPLPPAEAWAVLLDIESIATCIPGAELTEVVDERTYKGRVAVRLGPIALTLAGHATFEAIDGARLTAKVRARGSDPKGRGAADSVIDFRLEPHGAGTRVRVHTSVTLSGSIAQYGRGAGMIQAFAQQLIAQFGDNLKAHLAQAPNPARPVSGLTLMTKALWASMKREKGETMSTRWKNRPEGSNWGEFGEDDQRGRMNLVTAERRLRALQEVKTGDVFVLSHPLDRPGGNVLNPNRYPPVFHPVMRGKDVYFNLAMENTDPRFTDVGSDEAIMLYSQYSTHWDGFAHKGTVFDADGDGAAEKVSYNGYRLVDDAGQALQGRLGALALSVDRMAETGVQGRAVMIDLRHHFGDERVPVTLEMLERVMKDDAVTVEEGDIVCIHTGLGQLIREADGKLDPSIRTACTVLDGYDKRLLEWIADSGLAAIAADNLAVERSSTLGVDPRLGHRGPQLPLHEHCLVKLGIHLGELWYLTELAGWLRQNRRSRFLLTAPPLRMPGAAGSPVTPVATV